MANWVRVTITVTGDGEGKEQIKEGFRDATIDPNEATRLAGETVMPKIRFWNLPESSGEYLFDAGLVEVGEKLVITGYANWRPPLFGVLDLSSSYPSLTFELSGFEITNCYSQRWAFEGGNGWLLDCIQEFYEGDTDGFVIPLGEGFDEAEDRDRIVYMLNGEQYQRLPDWVAVEDKEVPPRTSASI